MDVGLFLDVSARYTLVRARFVGGDNDGKDLPYAPRHIANTALDIGHDIGLGAQLSYSYVDRQFADDINSIEPDITGRVGALDGYHRLDANIRYTNALTGLTATLSVKDLLDRPFIISRRPEGIFASGFRQITFGLRWDYASEIPTSGAP
jgi:Fe(3+) dicitrate transport protein